MNDEGGHLHRCICPADKESDIESKGPWNLCTGWQITHKVGNGCSVHSQKWKENCLLTKLSGTDTTDSVNNYFGNFFLPKYFFLLIFFFWLVI